MELTLAAPDTGLLVGVGVGADDGANVLTTAVCTTAVENPLLTRAVWTVEVEVLEARVEVIVLRVDALAVTV